MTFYKLLLLGAISSATMVGMSYAEAATGWALFDGTGSSSGIGEDGQPYNNDNSGPVYNEDGSINDGSSYSGPVYNEDGSLSDGSDNNQSGPKESETVSNNSGDSDISGSKNVKSNQGVVSDDRARQVVDDTADSANDHLVNSLNADTFLKRRDQANAAKKSLDDRYAAALAVQPKSLDDLRTKFKVLQSTQAAKNNLMNYQQSGNVNSLLNALKALRGK